MGALLSGGAAAGETGFAVVFPVFGGPAVGRVEDELVDGLGGHESLREKQIPHFVRNDMGALPSALLSPLLSGLPCAV